MSIRFVNARRSISCCRPVASGCSLSRAIVRFHRGAMPRVSPQHEQAVRDRIVRAALGVFAEHGFHRATMQDVVRASGLSVGAIYTYFKSKSELILAGCDLITDQELGELRDRLATVTDFRTRISVALGYFFDQFEETQAGRGSNV